MVEAIFGHSILPRARREARGVCILCVLLGLLGNLAQATGRPFAERWMVPVANSAGSGFYPGPGNPMHNAPHANPGVVQGVPVSNPAYRPAVPSRLASGYPQSARSSGPRVEQELADSTAYIHQGMVYTARVVSDQNLRTIRPVVSNSGGLVWEKLEGPLTTMRIRNGKSEIINEYRYLLTPITSGTLTLEPIRFTGTLVDTGRWPGQAQSREGARFDVAAGRPLQVSVLPAEPDVVPWLPLRGLKLEGRIDDESSVSEGKPVSLQLELKAVGAPGNRLPSLEPMLQGQGYDVYRESVSTEQSLVNGGQTLIGVRSEQYTLVPKQAGGLQLPEIRIGWFNVDTGLKEEAVLPVTRLVALGSGSGPIGGVGGSLPPIWIPFLIILVGTVGYWVSIALRGSGLGQRMYRVASGPVKRGYSAVATVARSVQNRLRPQRLLHMVQRGSVVLVPRPLRLWYCLRCIDDETDPAEWCQAFRFIASKHMGISDQLTTHGLMQAVIDYHPGAHASAIWELTHEIEGAMYGSASLDFEKWKSDFKRELRPMRLVKFRKRSRGRKGLPALNPGVALRG